MSIQERDMDIPKSDDNHYGNKNPFLLLDCYSSHPYEFNNPVYHYTSIDAFTKIIEQRKIWMTDFSGSNDLVENRVIYYLLDRICANLKAKSIPDEDIYLFYKNCKIQIEHTPLFISCFSKQKDLLSQWRGYANDGKGVAIGFKFKPQRFSELYPGIYAGKKHHYYAYELLYVGEPPDYDFSLPAAQITESILKYFKDLKNENLLWFSSFFSRLNAKVKHGGFKEEDEVRIATCPIVVSPPDANGKSSFVYSGMMKYIPCENSIKPIIEFPFETEEIVEVVIGPKNQTSKEILKAYLKLKGLEHVKVSQSMTTYR
ncbi:MAG TPA: DUF2971 domain-containing protein [Candidatus Ornithospirochaeta stercorigallinarum]|nr:DUF2971 domain-containing protein [Candidatus Ornithospirochaeta stercorigallinarum]